MRNMFTSGKLKLICVEILFFNLRYPDTTDKSKQISSRYMKMDDLVILFFVQINSKRLIFPDI